MQTYQTTPGAIPYRRGIFQEAMEYNSLTILDMSEKDKKYVLKQLIKINSGKDAKQFVANMSISTTPWWAYSDIDLRGRVGILKYKGIEVALFIERQLTKKRIDPEHPVSEAKMKDPKDAWMRFDLFGLSAQQSRRPTVELINKQQKEMEKLQQKVNTQAAMLDQLNAEVKRAKKNANKKRGRKASSKTKDDKIARRKKPSRHSKVVKRSRKSRR